MENTAKNVTLQLGSLISLFITIPALIALLFAVITVRFPDPASGYWEYESATTTIRTTIAFLIVFFPTYLVLTRVVNTMRRESEGTYMKITKWLIYIALLIGGGVLLGDLVATISGFLNGELTIRFILKALVVLVVVGVAFGYYLLDAQQYWQTHEKHSIWYGVGISIIVLGSLILGFFHTQTPAAVRDMKLDSQQVTDLQVIQSYILNEYDMSGTLPRNLSEISDQFDLPAAPSGRAPYTYEITEKGYELCAEFAYPTSESDQYATPIYYGDLNSTVKNVDNWSHKEGKWCFERIAVKSVIK